MKTMIRTQVQVTEEQDRRLEALAVSLRSSEAELVRQAVDLLLAQRVPEATPDERRRRALDAIGRFRSGRSDTARNHDAALVDAYAGTEAG
jgi:hypothetical protein